MKPDLEFYMSLDYPVEIRHRRLVQLAELEGCSLNQYVTTLLAEASTEDWLERQSAT